MLFSHKQIQILVKFLCFPHFPNFMHFEFSFHTNFSSQNNDAFIINFGYNNQYNKMCMLNTKL